MTVAMNISLHILCPRPKNECRSRLAPSIPTWFCPAARDQTRCPASSNHGFAWSKLRYRRVSKTWDLGCHTVDSPGVPLIMKVPFFHGIQL